MLLSIVIPVYNEHDTLPEILKRVALALPDVSKEVVIVDDGSSDGSRDWLQANFPEALQGTPLENAKIGVLADERKTSIRVHYHDQNLGKGAAVRSGLRLSTGDVIVIQDADLEYDPTDWQVMFDLIANRRVADVVYGSRFGSAPHRSLYFHHYLANRLISLLFNALYNQALTDIEVGYKMFSRSVRLPGVARDQVCVEIYHRTL